MNRPNREDYTSEDGYFDDESYFDHMAEYAYYVADTRSMQGVGSWRHHIDAVLQYESEADRREIKRRVK